MILRALLPWLATALFCLGEVTFDIPIGWRLVSESDAAEAANGFRQKRYVSADSLMEVVVVQHPPISKKDHIERAERLVIEQMSKSGYTHGNTSETKYKGYEARHLVGTLKPENKPGTTITSDCYLIATGDDFITIHVLVDEALNDEKMNDWIMNKMIIAGEPITLIEGKGGISEYSTAYKIGLAVAAVIGLGVLLLLIYVIMRVKGNKAEAPAPVKASAPVKTEAESSKGETLESKTRDQSMY